MFFLYMDYLSKLSPVAVDMLFICLNFKFVCLFLLSKTPLRFPIFPVGVLYNYCNLVVNTNLDHRITTDIFKSQQWVIKIDKTLFSGDDVPPVEHRCIMR